MNTHNPILLPNQLIDQPINWPRFYILPKPRYIKRQRAANSPDYHYKPKVVGPEYGTTSKEPRYFHRLIHRLTAARMRAWISVKRFVRALIRNLIIWNLVLLTIAACFSMMRGSPAGLPDNHRHIENALVVNSP